MHKPTTHYWKKLKENRLIHANKIIQTKQVAANCSCLIKPQLNVAIFHLQYFDCGDVHWHLNFCKDETAHFVSVGV